MRIGIISDIHGNAVALDVVLAADFQFIGNGQLAQCRTGIICEPDRANIFRVIGHRLEIERALELHHVATRVL